MLYIAAVAAEAEALLAQGVVDRAEELSRIASALVEAGREPPLRALRANAALGEAEAALAAAQAASITARLALAALWGETGEAPMISSAFPQIIPALPSPQSAESLEMRLAEAESDVALASVRQERSLAIPDLTASAGVRRYEETNDQAFVFGISIPMPFRDRNQGNIAVAQAQVTVAAAQAARARAAIAQRRRSAAAQYQAAQTRVATLTERTLPQSKEALRLARLGYRYGRFNLIDVLDAANALDGAQRSLIDAQTTLGLAASQLLRLAETQEVAR